MLSQSTKYKLYLLLKAISENECIVEEQRQRLSSYKDFEPYAAFKRIDRLNQGKISAHDICTFLNENMVDYVNEVECFYIFRYFDKDKDGYLDFDDFLRIVMPNDDMFQRAEIAQRENYRVKAYETLPKHLEFELSRLLEKEIHYHIKVEIEKKTLERQQDFNTVSSFTIIDYNKYGFLDFEAFKRFMGKFKKEMKKPDINAIIRRLDEDANGKITFNEFSVGITPEYPGLDPELMEFNVEEKEELVKQNKEDRKQAIKDGSPPPLRDFRNIYMQDSTSPVKRQFQELKLKQNVNPDKEYMIDLRKIGSPDKKEKAASKNNTINRTILKVDDDNQSNLGYSQIEMKFDVDQQSDHSLGNLSERNAQQKSKFFKGKGGSSQNIDYKSPQIQDKANKKHSQMQVVEFEEESREELKEKEKERDRKEKEMKRKKEQEEQKKKELQEQSRKEKEKEREQKNQKFEQKREQQQKKFQELKKDVDIIDLLQNGAKWEMEVEIARQNLVKGSEEFNNIDAFRILDRQAKGFVDAPELMKGLRQIGVDYDEDDVILFFQKFDKDESNKIKYSAFCDAFATKDDRLLEDLVSRVPRNLKLTMSYEQMFSQKTRQLYLEVWNAHVKCERDTELLRQKLLKNPQFDVQKAFREIDTDNKGYIVPKDVQSYLISKGARLSQMEMKLIFWKFNRKDAEGESISYAEFIEEITPRAALYQET